MACNDGGKFAEFRFQQSRRELVSCVATEAQHGNAEFASIVLGQELGDLPGSESESSRSK
jgi:hypothetical protein